MDLERIRKTIIIAVCSDDELCDELVLKGGNALRLIHGIGERTSLDIDFSMEADFDDPESVGRRLRERFEDRFDSAGFAMFDWRFFPRPRTPGPMGPKWGGYVGEFKLVSKTRQLELSADRDTLRRHALTIDGGPASSRTFRVEISKFEWCAGKQPHELEGYTVSVYTPAMIAAEKLRAFCQQMPECEPSLKQTARARDFYDIHAIISSGVDLGTPENLELVRGMFHVKAVDLALLDKLEQTRAFHASDWSSVELALGASAKRDYDFYFDAVVRMVGARLKALWVE